jgi:hypothetical protein
MTKKKSEKKFKICVSFSPPGGRWRKVCKRLTRRQISKLVGPIGKNMRITEVDIF